MITIAANMLGKKFRAVSNILEIGRATASNPNIPKIPGKNNNQTKKYRTCDRESMVVSACSCEFVTPHFVNNLPNPATLSPF